MNGRLVLLIVGSVLLSAGCRSQSLTREEAAGLIAGSEQFKAPATRTILLGPDLRGEMGRLASNWSRFDYDLADCLAGMEYLTRDHRGFILTDKGREAERRWGREPERPDGRIIPVAEPEFVELTGIVLPESGVVAEAQYTWRWKWTPIMNGMDCTDCGADCQITMAEKFGYQYSPEPRFKERKGTA